MSCMHIKVRRALQKEETRELSAGLVTQVEREDFCGAERQRMQGVGFSWQYNM